MRLAPAIVGFLLSSASKAKADGDITFMLSWFHRKWPAWAVEPFLACLALWAVTFFVESRIQKKVDPTKSKVEKEKKASSKDFGAFQRQWLVVYLLTMLADWLQGTHMYTLYTEYNQPVGTLYAIGFTSSAVFGTFLGLYVDKYGRKLGCIAFCVLELVINVLEHFNDTTLLVVGRVLGGMSTSLLFSAFESWMVSEHRKRGFPEEDIAQTFALAQVGNGIMAVLAGVLAQVSADNFGNIGPFQLAIFLTALVLVFVCFWPENYGGHERSADGKSDDQHIFKDAWTCMISDRKILLLGLIQSFFEGAMYTFVIMWVPTLAGMVPGGEKGKMDFAAFSQGQGWIFSSMMVCISLGGQTFEGMIKVMSVEKGCIFIFALASLSMLVPIFVKDFFLVLTSFLLLEACVGASFGALATMRSHFLPDSLQASIMNIFRIPLNILVVTGARCGDLLPPWMVFAVAASWFAVATLLQWYLYSSAATKGKSGRSKKAE